MATLGWMEQTTNLCRIRQRNFEEPAVRSRADARSVRRTRIDTAICFLISSSSVNQLVGSIDGVSGNDMRFVGSAIWEARPDAACDQGTATMRIRLDSITPMLVGGTAAACPGQLGRVIPPGGNALGSLVVSESECWRGP